MKKLLIETYGCQMNVADSEVVASVMRMAGYEPCEDVNQADAVFLNTCSVRDNAEQKIIHRLQALHALRKKGRRLILGVLGCMAERVKDDLLEKHHADIVAGPDAYLSLPDLIAQAEVGQKAINIDLSLTETYGDIMPERFCGSKISGFVSITRGCNNFCHFCIVPYTRGRERSRNVQSIINECLDLQKRGFKEVTLLGQNVNSYKAKRDASGDTERPNSELEEFEAQTRDKAIATEGIKSTEAEADYNKDYVFFPELLRTVAGPDAYLSLPDLIAQAEVGQKAINIDLSLTETYGDIMPERFCGSKISGFVSITRGCNNFCHFCIVPYTRGRERSRNVQSIINECLDLQKRGFKEVTLLGQNVNSYKAKRDASGDTERPNSELEEFEAQTRDKAIATEGIKSTEAEADYNKDYVFFPELLRTVARAVPDMRIRFSTPHPKDMSDATLRVIAEEPNVCRHIHFPVQSGSDAILKKMNRKYNREWYMNRVKAIHDIIEDCAISTDIFAGYCGETEEDHQLSLSLMREVGYDSAFMFKYSERPGTYAFRNLEDDIPEDTKIRRLNEMIALQNELSLKANEAWVGREADILLEGVSKRSREELFGRTEQNKVVIIPRANHRIGQTVRVRILAASSATLKGEVVETPEQA